MQAPSTRDARGRARLRLRSGGPDRRGGHGCALPALDARPLSRAAGPLGDGPGGGPLRDRGCGARDRRSAARPDRRGDDRERRADQRRQRAQHRAGVVRARGGSPLARRTQARRPRQEMLDTFAYAASVAECTLETEVSETYQGYRFKDGEPIVQLAATALERCGYELVQHSRAAGPTRTSSTRAGCRASTSRTGWPRSTRRTSTSPLPTRRDGRRDARTGRCRSGLDAVSSRPWSRLTSA